MRTRPSHLSAGRQRQFLSGDEGLLEVYYRPHDLAHPAAGLHKTSKLITETCIYRGLDRPSGHPDSKYAYRTTNLFLMFPAAVEGKRHVEVKDLHTVRNNLRYSRNYPTGIFPTRRNRPGNCTAVGQPYWPAIRNRPRARGKDFQSLINRQDTEQLLSTRHLSLT